MIIIVDYGMGNLRSIQNMLKHLNVSSEISSDREIISAASKIILPGVGSFEKAVENIDRLGIRDLLIEKARHEKIPFLGICLGMQLLGDSSEEGTLPGLGLVPGRSAKFNFESNKMKIPHMGWNTVSIIKDDVLFGNMHEDSRFYFVHSYHFVCENETDILTITEYGNNFISAISNENIRGVQFHPEKSHKFGMKLLKNFSELKQDVNDKSYALSVA
ncbi:MAG: imidazole glycerol phosphate synthase subunit HisH [candidate division Zixibacteria bacterium]